VLEAEMKRNEDSFKKEMGEIRAPNSQLKELLEATKKKGPTTDPNLWTVAEVIDWLKQKPLRSFAAIAQKFEEENIIGEVFLELKQEDLNGLGITLMGDQKIILNQIKDAKKITEQEKDQEEV
jgi:hypothetical protein